MRFDNTGIDCGGPRPKPKGVRFSDSWETMLGLLDVWLLILFFLILVFGGIVALVISDRVVRQNQIGVPRCLGGPS